MAGSWLPTSGERGISRIQEWEGDKSKWWGWEEGKGNREEDTWGQKSLIERAGDVQG